MISNSDQTLSALQAFCDLKMDGASLRVAEGVTKKP